MKKLGILLDSFGGISQKIIEENGFNMVPLQFNIDGKDYIDNGKELTNLEISELVKNSSSARTSLPALGTIEQVLEKMSKEYENVIVFLTSSILSSTYQTVYVESRKYGDKFHIIDNHFFTDQALELGKFLVKQSNEGINISKLVEVSKEVAKKSLNYLIVKDLTSLIKGGRLKGIKKMILNGLKLIPLLKVDEEGINFGGVKRTLRGSYEKVFEKLLDFIGGREFLENYEFKFMYANDPEMKEEIEKLFNKENLLLENITIASATVMIHTGIGCSSLGIWPKLSKLKI
ncbi:DegV family protein [Mesomycoplasma molare]|uniref:DegV family protein n=1 Tax=Mesomycoplasma molare TaxID=171288 RepID=A0ABY5TXZ5_9BACT|nr:DegV family protein [Mesomycoplasma molare]UWD34386.1 DegV family protein [Mesomycoplasma molare]